MLVDEAEGADLLVVGSRGHGGFAGLLLGSVSQQCAQHASCPVVIIRDTSRVRRDAGLDRLGRAQPLDDVVLKDGSTLRLRAPVAADGPALVAFFERLSPESRYLRFHGARRVTPSLVAPFLDPDWAERGALIGTLADEAGAERVVALANYVRLRGPARAEVAFAVEDDLQRPRYRHAAPRAARRARGCGGDRALRGARAGREPADAAASSSASASRRPASSSRARSRSSSRSRRPRASSSRSTGATTPPCVPRSSRSSPRRSVAVLGASPRRGSIGGELYRNILRSDFTGAAYPGQPEGSSVGGRARLRDASTRYPDDDRPRGDLRAGRVRARARPRRACAAASARSA